MRVGNDTGNLFKGSAWYKLTRKNCLICLLLALFTLLILSSPITWLCRNSAQSSNGSMSSGWDNNLFFAYLDEYYFMFYYLAILTPGEKNQLPGDLLASICSSCSSITFPFSRGQCAYAILNAVCFGTSHLIAYSILCSINQNCYLPAGFCCMQACFFERRAADACVCQEYWPTSNE